MTDILDILIRQRTPVSIRAANEIMRLRRLLNPLSPNSECEPDLPGVEIEPTTTNIEGNIQYWEAVEASR